jgi:hypothetical protein
VPPKILRVKQKALSNMPHGKDMAMSSALIYTSRKPVQCTENKLKLNIKNYWSNYDFYCLLYFI